MAANEQKSWDRACYAKKKLHLLDFEPATTANTPDDEAVVTTDSATAVWPRGCTSTEYSPHHTGTHRPA